MAKRLLGVGSIFIAFLFVFGSFAPTVQAARGLEQQSLPYGKYYIGDEIIELRTENSKTKWLGGDRYSVEISMGAIHYKNNYANPAEQWKDIDLTWQQGNQITKAPYILTVNPDNYSLTMYDKKTGSSVSLALSTIGGKTIKKVTGKTSRDSILFSDVATDLNIEIVASNTGVRFKRILKSGRAPVDAIFGISQSGRGLVVTSEARYSDNGELIPVIFSKNSGLLTETVDKAKIKRYPVEIDPNVTIQPSNKDTYFTDGAVTASYGTNVNLLIEDNTTLIYRSLVQFDIMGALPGGVNLTLANLSLYHAGDGIGVTAGRTYNADRLVRLNWLEGITETPSTAGATWTNFECVGPTAWTGVGCGNDGADFTSANRAQAVVSAIGAWTVWNVLAQVQVAYAATNDAGFRIADNGAGGVPRHQCQFRSNNFGVANLRPKLYIEYTIVGAAVFTLAADTIEDTTANVSGNVTDDAGEIIEYYGFVWDTADQGDPGNIATDNVANGWANGWRSALGDWGEGVRTHSLAGLSTGTTYHFRFAASGNVTGWVYGAADTFLTKPAAPANVAATSGTHSDNVTISWDASVGADDYEVFQDGVGLGASGNVTSYQDATAGAPTITPGNADASDGTSAVHVTLTLAGHHGNDGTTHTYLVVANNATGNSDNSTSDTGYRGITALTYQWQRSAADADAAYGNIGGGTTNPYNDIGGVAHPDGRYYQCVVSMYGAANQTSTSNRGYMAVAPTVTTGLCTGFGTTWAVVNGTITDLGFPAGVTQIGFDYGITGAYGSSVTEAGVYVVGTNYSILLTGLNPATVYHYRFKAFNSVWGYGTDRTFATEGSASLYEHLSAGSDNCTMDIYGANWEEQTFTTAESHTVSSVWLNMQRTGAAPGTVTASFRRTSDNVSTGTDLGVATYNGNTFATTPSWYEFVFSPEIRLETSTQYAVVVRAIDGDNANDVQWCMVNAGGLAIGEPGEAGRSADSGSSWTSDAPADHLMQIWGYPCMDIENVKVFTDYQTTGDWLIVIRYINIYSPYYDDYDVKSYFVLQFTDASGNVKAQVACPSWDYMPGSIYLAPSLTTALTYGGDYRVRLYGTFAGNPYTEYTIQATDWLGNDLTRLDSWVITSAKSLADYYDEVLTTYIAGKDEVLNTTGGVIFANGITALIIERPHLFQIVSTPLIPEVGDFPQAGEGAAVWQTLLGPYVSGKLTATGTIFGVDGKAFGAWILIGTMICLMVYGLPTGHTAPANILATPIFLMGLGLRLFDWATGAIMLCLMAFLLFYQLWFKYG